MRHLTGTGLLAGILLAAGSGAAQESPYKLRDGEKPPTQHVDAAISIVSAMLRDPALRMRLVNEFPGRINSDGSIAVYVVVPDDAASMVVRVPEGCRCIVIGGSEFEAAFEKLAAEGPLMAGHEVEMLSFLLLHELGHIHHGHYGQFLPDPESAFLNLDENATKAREDQADAFAADALRAAFEELDSGTPVMAAMNVIMFVQSLSFVVSARASIGTIGGRVLGDPAIFWDHSRSHRNFEYRLLILNHAISPTETSQQLLNDYERARQGSGRSIRVLSGGKSVSYDENSEEFRALDELLEVLPP